MGGGGGFLGFGPVGSSATAPAASVNNYWQQQVQAQKDADQKAQDALKAQITQMSTSPGYVSYAPTDYEKQAGVTAGFQGITDPTTGQLLSQYSVNPLSDPYSQELAKEATSQGPSPWASSALSQQGFEQGQAMGQAGQQAQTATDQAESGIARGPGLSSGAATSLAKAGERNLLAAQQGVGAQGIEQRYGINQADIQRKQQLTGNLADLERQAQIANIQAMEGNMANRQAFDVNRYNQQMAAWAAKQTAGAMG